PAFGNQGIVILKGFLPGVEFATDVAIQSNGKIVISGNVHNEMIVERFQPDGTVDSSFGMNGIVNAPIPVVSLSPVYLAVQPNGRLLLLGTDYRAPNFQIARLNS